jgi:SAM-dependent methyltransferase
MPGPDQRGRERADVGIGRDAAQFALGGEVGGDHGRGLGQDRDAGQPGLTQPGAQVIPEGDEGDDFQGDGPEQGHQRAGEVIGDGARSCGVTQGGGLAARQFQAAGCRVLGVDPDGRMADLARRNGVEVEAAAFEAWNPAGREFDAVIAGQAWHWVNPVAGAAKAAQALRPGGRLAVFWNAAQTSPEISEAFAGVYQRVQTGLPFDPWARPALDSCLTMCGQAADAIRQAGRFGQPEQWRFDWDRRYTRGEWLEQVPTFGGHSQIPPARLQELLAGIGAAVDAVGGSFTVHYATLAVTAARTGAADPA